MIWSCTLEPTVCRILEFIYDYQSLVAALLALIAAVAGLWAPIYVHFRSERERQVGRINAYMLHITSLGVHAARWVRLLKSAYLGGSPENTVEIALPNLRRDVSRLEEAIKLAHEAVAGPDNNALALILWRITNMRIAADNASDLASVIEINLTGQTRRDVTPTEFDEIEEHLLNGMAAELPAELQTIR